MRSLAHDPSHSALCLDFDGTLSSIVDDPGGAVPVPGVTELLARLADRFGSVAVISGRPVRFLAEALSAPAGVQLIGLYGLETLGPDGSVVIGEEAQRWEAVVADAAWLAASSPPGVYVEPKGLTVTLHWRQAPHTEQWVEDFAAQQVAERGLALHRGRMSIELGPPLDVDKGTVVRAVLSKMGAGLRAVGVFGDDLGDLPAFAAAAEWADRGVAVARVAVVDAESPPEVAAQADLVVQGAEGAVTLLEQLMDAASSSVRSGRGAGR
jgi:trehalose 6-phosphate phosphatase